MSSTATLSPAAPEADTARGVRRMPVVVLSVVLAVVFLGGASAAWFFTIDDAFISFRYAKNLADGHGPVWNLTGQPVEGFTNFAWVAWSAVGSLLGVGLFTKLTSLVLGAATLYLLVSTGRRYAGLGGAVVAFVLFVPTYFHLTGGLETTTFAAVLLRVAVLGLRVLDKQPVRDWELPLLLLLAGTLRPEGMVAALPAFLVWIWHERHRVPPRWYTAAAIVLGAGYFVWRWQYYGHLLPNTFYVKFGHLDAGYLWSVHTAKVLAPLIVLTAALIVRRATRAAGLLLTATVAVAYATYAVSGPTMDFLNRFADHAFPILCLGAGLAMKGLVPRPAAALAGTVAVAWTAYFGAVAPDLPATANYGPDLQRTHVAIGKALASADVPDAARTLAVSDAGAIPYYSGWHTIDYIGLNDAAIAHGANPTTVVATARPTVVVITSTGTTPGIIDPDKYGLNTAEATRGYDHIASVHMRDGYYQEAFTLPEHAQALRTAITSTVDAAQAANDPGRYDSSIGRWLVRLQHQITG